MSMLAELVDVVIGVDTHKHTHTAAVVAAATGHTMVTMTVAATPGGLPTALGTRPPPAQSTDLGDREHRRLRRRPDPLPPRSAGTGCRAGPAHEPPCRCGWPPAAQRSRPPAMPNASCVPWSSPHPRPYEDDFRMLDPPAGRRLRPVTRPGQLGRRDRHHGRDLAELGPSEPRADRRGRRPPPSHPGPGAGLAPRPAHPNRRGPDRGRNRAVRLVHPGCCRSDAAFAMLGGAAPIPASSGQTIRVWLNRSGDCQLNQALYTVVLTRLRTDPATRAYATRRRAEGKTNREIKRCLVRYVGRQLYRLLEAAPAIDTT